MMNHHPKALRRYSVASLVTDQVGRFWKADPGHSPKAPKKMMRHADIRTTMSIYGDVVTDEMTTAGIKVAQLAFQGNGAQAERGGS
jgi:hypothetical protein